jgi:hypothetical protein
MKMNEMKQEKIKQTFKGLYEKGLSVQEKDIFKTEKKLYEDILEEFGSWGNFESELGLLKRHSREREKFDLYQKYKKIAEVQQLDKNSISGSDKEEIQQYFTTMKKFIEDVIYGDSEEALLYDARQQIKEDGELSQKTERKLIKKFGGNENWKDEYAKKFLYHPEIQEAVEKNVEPVKETPKAKGNEKVGEKLVITISAEQLVQMGILTEGQVDEITREALKLNKNTSTK